MRKLIALGVVVLLLIVNTVIIDRETKDAEQSRGARIMELDGGDLSYKEEGDRDDPTIVLLHGFACSKRWWNRVAPELARRGLRVIRFDLLGHGDSEMPRDGYEIENQASLVGQALQKLRVRRAVVVGHSMGGNVASALVEQNPRLVRKLAVIATPPRDGFVDEALLRNVSTWPVVGELARRFTPDAVIKAGLDPAFADDVEVPDAFVDDLDGMTYSAYDKSGTASQEFLEDRPSSDRVEEARVPLLVIFGTEDEIVDPEAADAWKEDVPRARVVQLREVGHSPHWEQPRAVAQMLLDLAR
ncbi:MAG: alpha/beta fold hydrolase [Thermoleophilaceae bacterium]